MADGTGFIDLASIFNAAEAYKARKLANQQAQFQFKQQQQLPQARAAAQQGDYSQLAQLAPSEFTAIQEQALKQKSAQFQNQERIMRAQKLGLESQGMATNQAIQRQLKTAQAVKQAAQNTLNDPRRFRLEISRLGDMMQRGVIDQFPLDQVANDPKALKAAIQNADATIASLDPEQSKPIAAKTTDLQNFAGFMGYSGDLRELHEALKTDPALREKYKQYIFERIKTGVPKGPGDLETQEKSRIQGRLREGAQALVELKALAGQINPELFGASGLLKGTKARAFDYFNLSSMSDKDFIARKTKLQRDALNLVFQAAAATQDKVSDADIAAYKEIIGDPLVDTVEEFKASIQAAINRVENQARSNANLLQQGINFDEILQEETDRVNNRKKSKESASKEQVTNYLKELQSKGIPPAERMRMVKERFK